MNMKPAMLVAALAAAALATAGCEQRANEDVSKRDTASGGMAQTTPGMRGSTNAPPGSTNTPPGTSSPGPMASSAPEKNVAESTGDAASDAAITAKVKAKILAEPGLKSLSINVDTKDATVTLSGDVASEQARDRAKQIAMSTDGVKNVVDNLNVKAS
ncbi:MAG TPA: BON domain-containing protein [Casimicrobiaceae bacterium]|nr:BON domain-containing protein [Casimicrobiaceae bacterium]